MKLVYTHPNIMVVENARNLLEQAGIRTKLENQYAAGGIGELAPINAWPEVWIERDMDLERARLVLERLQEQANEPDWTCRQCNETNSPAFEFCWQCQTPRYGAAP